MTDASQIRARWTGETFAPVGNWSVAWCHDHLKEGENVALDVERPRSGVSHRHQFAEIREAWMNLPEVVRDAPYARTAETLRKHALIVTGYCDVVTIDAGSAAAAERVTAYAKTAETRAHGYAIVVPRGPIVTIYTPRSQSMRAMGGAEFQKSKTRVLEWIADAIGVTPEELRGAE